MDPKDCGEDLPLHPNTNMKDLQTQLELVAGTILDGHDVHAVQSSTILLDTEALREALLDNTSFVNEEEGLTPSSKMANAESPQRATMQQQVDNTATNEPELAEDTNKAEEEEHHDDESDQESCGSTYCYEQEHFETFKHKVVALCESLWPHRKGQINVQRLSGGSYHRIIGISIIPIKAPDTKLQTSMLKKILQLLQWPKKLPAYLWHFIRPTAGSLESKAAPSHEYILRTPRDPDNRNLAQEAAILRFAKGLSASFAVPSDVRIDTTPDNPLGRPYAIQERIPGITLNDLWKDLNQQQKISLASQVGTFFQELSQHTYTAAGTIDPTSVTEEGSPCDIRIFEFEFTRPVRIEPGVFTEVTKNPRTIATPQTTLEVLQSRYEVRRVWDRHPDYPDTDSLPYRKLKEIVAEQQLRSSLWSPEDRFYVAHNDFFPRNIMARVLNDSKAEITGILDWDLTTIAPAVVAFQPPWWLWKYEQYEADDEEPYQIRDADHYAAVTEEEKEIRDAFEVAAGEELLAPMNAMESCAARNLWQWAESRVDSNEEFGLINEMMEKWEMENWADEDFDIWAKAQDDADNDREEDVKEEDAEINRQEDAEGDAEVDARASERNASGIVAAGRAL
jgi:hypothetical protein